MVATTCLAVRTERLNASLTSLRFSKDGRLVQGGRVMKSVWFNLVRAEGPIIWSALLAFTVWIWFQIITIALSLLLA